MYPIKCDTEDSSGPPGEIALFCVENLLLATLGLALKSYYPLVQVNVKAGCPARAPSWGAQAALISEASWNAAGPTK